MPVCPPRASTPSPSAAGTPTGCGSSPSPPGRPGCSAESGGFGDATVTLPAGTWHDVLSDDEAVCDGAVACPRRLLAHRPVALLVRQS